MSPIRVTRCCIECALRYVLCSTKRRNFKYTNRFHCNVNRLRWTQTRRDCEILFISREAIHKTFTIPDAPKYWCHKINKTALKPNDSFMHSALVCWVNNAWWCSANICAITNANNSPNLSKNYSVLSCYSLSPSKSTDIGFTPSSAKPNLQFMLIKAFFFYGLIGFASMGVNQTSITK